MNKILIVGARRCGTTFVGKVLCQSKKASYFFEPFNKDQGIKYLPNVWYPCINEESVSPYQDKILNEIFNKQKGRYKVSLYSDEYTWWDLNRWDLLKNVFTNFSKEGILMRLVRVGLKNRSNFEYLKFKFSKGVKHIIYKDPLASLSSKFLQQRYNLKVVALLRHPYSYYYSMKKQDWGADPYANFYSQKSLINKEYLAFMEDKLSKYNNDKGLYALIEYYLVYRELLKHLKDNNYLFIRHEDLALEPKLSFEKIFKFCSLSFNNKVEDYILSNTSSNNKADTLKVSSTKRDSKAILKNWQGKISEKEKSMIKDITFDVVKEFYKNNEW